MTPIDPADSQSAPKETVLGPEALRDWLGLSEEQRQAFRQSIASTGGASEAPEIMIGVATESLASKGSDFIAIRDPDFPSSVLVAFSPDVLNEENVFDAVNQILLPGRPERIRAGFEFTGRLSAAEAKQSSRIGEGGTLLRGRAEARGSRKVTSVSGIGRITRIRL